VEFNKYFGGTSYLQGGDQAENYQRAELKGSLTASWKDRIGVKDSGLPVLKFLECKRIPGDE
jgi:hypothetical protein